MKKIKVFFRVEQDSEGFPPAGVESVWALVNTGGSITIDNIPFFSREATLGDEVAVQWIDNEAFFDEIIVRSTNSLLRVILFERALLPTVESKLHSFGCLTEQSHIKALISVSVPASTPLDVVRIFLDSELAADHLDYEEPIVRQ